MKFCTKTERDYELRMEEVWYERGARGLQLTMQIAANRQAKRAAKQEQISAFGNSKVKV
jgi:hypothetical protein